MIKNMDRRAPLTALAGAAVVAAPSFASAATTSVDPIFHGLAAYAAVGASQDFTEHDRTAIDVLASALQALVNAAA
jgi:hypothetical protein